MIDLFDGGPGLQWLAFENGCGETGVLRDAEPQQGGTLRLAAKQARISTQISSRCTPMHADRPGSGLAVLARSRRIAPDEPADTRAPVPSACIGVHLLLICVEILACFAARRIAAPAAACRAQKNPGVERPPGRNCDHPASGYCASLRRAKRRRNSLPDELPQARQAGDCFVASLLATTGGV
jgi:hypothetical protein